MLNRTRPVVLAAAVAVSWASQAGAAKLIEKNGDWSLFVHEAAQKKICFAASQPSDSAPNEAKREQIYFYVSAWPKDGVKSEVSVLLGYPVKKGSDVVVSVGGRDFKLFAQDDKAFVADPNDELKLIDAMRRGNDMKVAATSEAGTATEDSFSLRGITATLRSMDDKCN
ncbi:MAG: invasion associated locus B family protein [Hyphomicrobiaceae bacterium]